MTMVLFACFFLYRLICFAIWEILS